MGNLVRLMIERTDGIIQVLILPHKDGKGWSYINLTKGHICPCIFSSIEDAINDLKNRPEVINFKILKEVII